MVCVANCVSERCTTDRDSWASAMRHQRSTLGLERYEIDVHTFARQDEHDLCGGAQVH